MNLVERHLERKPHARPSTIRGLAKKQQTTGLIEQYVRDKRRREFFAKVTRVLMPWRG